MSDLTASLALDGDDVAPDQAFMVASDLRKILSDIDGVQETKGAPAPEGTKSATLLGLATVLVTSGTVIVVVKAIQNYLETKGMDKSITINWSKTDSGEHKTITVAKGTDPQDVAKIVAELD